MESINVPIVVLLSNGNSKQESASQANSICQAK